MAIVLINFIDTPSAISCNYFSEKKTRCRLLLHEKLNGVESSSVGQGKSSFTL